MGKYNVMNFLRGSNSDEALQLIDSLVKENLNICVTGQLNTGKTNMLKSLLNHQDSTSVVRVIESSFYKDLASNFPNKAIIINNDLVVMKDLENLYSSFDKVVVVLDEVDSKETLQYYLNQQEIPETNTLITHYGNSSTGLVYALTNEVMSHGLVTDLDTAHKLVLDNVKIDINVVRSENGIIYLNRISMINRLSYDSSDFEVRDMLKYDISKDRYDILAVRVN